MLMTSMHESSQGGNCQLKMENIYKNALDGFWYIVAKCMNIYIHAVKISWSFNVINV